MYYVQNFSTFQFFVSKFSSVRKFVTPKCLRRQLMHNVKNGQGIREINSESREISWKGMHKFAKAFVRII